MSSQLAERIKQRAKELGFDLCGIAPAAPSAFREEFLAWLDRGEHGEMAYLQRNSHRRLDPQQVLPGVKSIVVVGMNYYTQPQEPPPDAGGSLPAQFARYALNDDYHDVMAARLHQLLDTIRAEAPCPVEGKVYVDTGPVLEREIAQRAGLGWIGKNTMLIHPRLGSYFLLGEILLTLPLPTDAPIRGSCGTCNRCIEACPTGALVSPYHLDARRCISYLTIEMKGPMPEALAPLIGNRIFGCDICQEVCPFCVRFSRPTKEAAFQPRPVTVRSTLKDLMSLSDEGFRSAFRKSPVKRAKRRGLLRNVAAALASSGDPQAAAVLRHAAETDTDAFVRSEAERALQRMQSPATPSARDAGSGARPAGDDTA
ncbi:MAG: tRNA epoxyqueuosine(34) reductase QueG [Chthonomonadales bacterium]